MAGGTSDDTYVITEPGDRVVERVGQCVDRVICTMIHVLASNVENLKSMGTLAVTERGTRTPNRLFGNGAANALSGAALWPLDPR